MTRLVVAMLFACLATPVLAAPCAGFADVDDADPFCPNVTWIRNRNITLGCAAGLYCPDATVSRLSMAAFLNRLGDVLLPPNVIWVAPAGGQFQSIQAAIDYAASLPGSARRLVKVAPGTFNEPIVMASSVDIEGSGPGATTISSAVCGPGAPTAGTVTGASDAQLRDVTVLMSGSAGLDQCAAVYLDNVNGTALRNVRVHAQVIGGGGGVYGIIAVSTSIVGGLLTLDQVNVDMDDLGGPRTGILIDVPAYRSTRLQDVAINGVAENSPMTGLRLAAGDLALERVRVSVPHSLSPFPTAVGLRLAGGTTATVERSSLRSSATGSFADVAAGATLRIAHSLLDGALVGAATCFSTHDAGFAPVTC